MQNGGFISSKRPDVCFNIYMYCTLHLWESGEHCIELRKEVKLCSWQYFIVTVNVCEKIKCNGLVRISHYNAGIFQLWKWLMK